MSLDDWKDTLTDEQVKDHAALMVRILKFYMDEFRAIGLSKKEAIDAGMKIIVAGIKPREEGSDSQ